MKIYMLILVNSTSLNKIYTINRSFNALYMRIHPKILLLLDSLITLVEDDADIMLMKTAMQYVN